MTVHRDLLRYFLLGREFNGSKVRSRKCVRRTMKFSFFVFVCFGVVGVEVFAEELLNLPCKFSPSRSCANICNATGYCEIRAAVLLPGNSQVESSLSAVMPVLELAEQEVRRRALLPASLFLRFIPYDDHCNSGYAALMGVDAYTNDCVHVFFGPVCEYALASVSRITKGMGQYGTPLLTAGGLSYDFTSDKRNCSREFYMLTRIGTVGFEDISSFMISIMYKYGWKKIVTIYDPQGQSSKGGESTCHLMMKTLVNFLKKEPTMISSPWDTSQNTHRNISENLKHILAMTYTSKWGHEPFYFPSRVANDIEKSFWYFRTDATVSLLV